MKPPSRGRRMGRNAVVLAAGLIGTGVAVTAAMTPQEWHDGEERGRFRSVYNGFGSVTGDDDSMLLEPNAARNHDTTHGALVVTREEFRDVSFDVVMTTERQVRKGEPNPWEMGWVLWNYTDDDHFYAVALKPNGWEVSKQDPAYPGAQRFLVTGEEPTFQLNRSYRVDIEQKGADLRVSVDGELLAALTDKERPYISGAIGFYTEDARVRFADLTIASAPE